MGYYTGPVFELRHSSAGYSFGGGGRYDQLVGRFSGQQIPACGFSIGFERLALLLAEQESRSQAGKNTVFIPVFLEELRAHVLQIAQALRSEQIPVDVYPDTGKLKAQFKFASDLGYQWVLIIGSDEWNSRVFKVKNFVTGQEEGVPEKELLHYLKRLSKST